MSTSFSLWLLGTQARLLFDTRQPTGPRVASPTVVEDLNATPILTFSMATSHPLYGAISPLNSWIEVRENGVDNPVGRFRVVFPEGPGPAGIVKFTCHGVEAVLNDTRQPHWSLSSTPANIVSKILANHNVQARLPNGNADPYRQLTLGTVSSDLDPNNLIVRSVDAYPYPTSMEILKRSTWDSSAGGFVRVRTVANGTNYVDWLSTGGVNLQVIRFGGTLIDWNQLADSTNVITACEPIGAEIDDEGNRLLLGDGDGGTLLYTDSEGVGHYGFVNTEAQAVYGLIVASATWDDVTTKPVLLQRATDYVAKGSLTQVTISSKVIDQHLIDPVAYQTLQVGDNVRFQVPPIGLNQLMRVSSRRLVLDDAAQWQVTLGAKRATLVDKVADFSRTADQVIQVVESNARLNEAVTEIRVIAEGAETTAENAQTTAVGAQSTANAAQTTATGAASTAAGAASSAAAAQTAANAAWTAAGTSNLIKDPCFQTTSATDHLIDSATGTGADIAAARLLFNATGFTGVKPSPATTYAKTVANVGYYSRGTVGTTGGIQVKPGQTFRLSIDAACDGSVAGATKKFGLIVSYRLNGTWTGQRLTASEILPTTAAETTMRHVTQLWTVPVGVDAIRPGFGANASSGTNSVWWVTNFACVDVSEGQDAKVAAEAAARAAATAQDSYSWDGLKDLTGITWDGSGASRVGSVVVAATDGALRPSAMISPVPTTGGNFWVQFRPGLMQLKQGLLYEVSVTVRVPTQTPAAAGNVYAGVSGVKCNPDGTFASFINISGSASYTAAFYFAASASTVPKTSGQWTTFRGYFRKAAAGEAVSTGVRPDPNTPGIVHPNATHVWPMVLMAYNEQSDLCQISDVSITSYPLSSAGLIAEANRAAVAAAQAAADAASGAAADLAQSIVTLTSLIQQQADSLMTTIGQTYELSSDAATAYQNIQSTITQLSNSVTLNFEETNAFTQQVNDALISQFAALNVWFRFGTSGLIFGRTDSPLTLTITNSQLSFLQNGNVVAYISNNQLVITDAWVQGKLRVGTHYVWQEGADNHLTCTSW